MWINADKILLEVLSLTKFIFSCIMADCFNFSVLPAAKGIRQKSTRLLNVAGSQVGEVLRFSCWIDFSQKVFHILISSLTISLA